jgi:DnaJ-class molecular chaperone
MEDKDLYAILGITRNASKGDIKSAFHKLALQCHPDMRPGDVTAEARFREISEAYSVLADPDKRERYDAHGPGGQAYEATAPFDFYRWAMG